MGGQFAPTQGGQFQRFLHYTDDIDDQGTFNNTHSTIETANNYGYDELGNLVRDVQEEIASIQWTVYGKMKKITRTGASSKADLEFGYDASGNRLWKKVTPKGSGAVILTYYYLRDAQGNEMCRYVKYTNTSSQLMYVAQEHSIYGSSRVGVDNRKDTLYMGAAYTNTWGGVGTSRRELGLKSFELANHLGNVLVTVSDKPVYKVSSTTIFFQPEISSISDYYPFGAPIQGRSAAFGNEYRFGYQNQEKDDEISGPGNHNTAQFWEYDGRLGRRWNLDPVVKPWESLYACLSNNPIWFLDLNGDDDSFNSSGALFHHSTNGSKIYIQTADGFKLPSQLHMDMNNRQILATVAGHYARQRGIYEPMKVGNEPTNYGNTGNLPGGRSIAYTIGNSIHINARGGFVNPLLDDYYNFQNVLYHENRHKIGGHGFKNITAYEHALVYLHQLDDPIFINTNNDFKKSFANTIQSYLNEATKDELKNPYGPDLSKIQNAVDELNKKSKTIGFVFIFSTNTHNSQDPSHTTFELTKKSIN